MTLMSKSVPGRQLQDSSGTSWSIGSLGILAGSVLVIAVCSGFLGISGPTHAHAVPMQVAMTQPLDAKTQSASQRCDSCHTFDASFSHPTGTLPSMAIPPGFPLEAGRMTCLTCHTDEAAQPHGINTPASETAMLRGGNSGIGLCSSCHQTQPGASRGFHGSNLVRAHLQPATWKASPSGALDSESGSCVGCHDGSMARDAGGHAMSGSENSTRGDHPIAVEYRSRPATRDSDAIRLVNMAALDRRVRLFDRAVGCGSCHSVYSPHADLLVIPNIRSQLCLSCHSL